MRGEVIVWYDSETGGLLPQHPTTQLAAIAVDSDWRELETFEVKFQFDVDACEPEALKLNGYSPEKWANAVPEAAAWQQFQSMLNRHRCVELISRAGKPYSVARLAGHNIVGFDLPRTEAAFKRLGLFLPICFRTLLDTRYGAVWHFERLGVRPKDFKLTGLAEHFGIPTAGAHDALADVRMTIELAKRLA